LYRIPDTFCNHSSVNLSCGQQKTHEGVALLLLSFLTSPLDGGEWPGSRASRFTSGNSTVFARGAGGWVGLVTPV